MDFQPEFFDDSTKKDKSRNPKIDGKERRMLILVGSIMCAGILLIAVIIIALGLTGNLVSIKKDITEESRYITYENLSYGYMEVAQKVVKSAVTVQKNKFASVSLGAGVVVAMSENDDIYVLTNDHVVDGGGTVTVSFYSYDSNEKIDVQGEVMAEQYTSGIDLALIKIVNTMPALKGVNTEPVEIAPETDIKFGTSGVMIGNPKGMGLMVAGAMVSNPSTQYWWPTDTLNDFIAIDAPVNPGNSGGGFFDMQGRLMGIVTLRKSDDQLNNEHIIFGIGYAVRPGDIVKYLAAYGIKDGVAL